MLQQAKFENVVVVGGGYVGLPLAVQMAAAGLHVTVVDNDPQKIAKLISGESYVEDVPSEQLQAMVGRGRIDGRFNPSSEIYSNAQAIVICVPTPLRKTKEPDVSFIDSALDKLIPHIQRGQLIVLESTTYPGYTREAVAKRIEEERSFVVGSDVCAAFSPERIDPANKEHKVQNVPKVVGGVTPACTKVAEQFYSIFMEQVVPVKTAEAAELVKLLENTFRAVNIALANEFALVCSKLGADVWEVIEAASTKPYGFMPFYPGPGVGGHCIKPDPLYLSWRLKGLGQAIKLIDLADAVNASMPGEVVKLVTESLNRSRKSVNGSWIHILGVAYKPNVGDTRESPALDVMERLGTLGAMLTYQDPFVPEVTQRGRVYKSYQPDFAKPDCVLVLTDHHEFYRVGFIELLGKSARLIIDTRNLTAAIRENDPACTDRWADIVSF